jgi:hypothetical protein
MVLTFPLQEMAFLNDNTTHGSVFAMEQVSTLLTQSPYRAGDFQGAKKPNVTMKIRFRLIPRLRNFDSPVYIDIAADYRSDARGMEGSIPGRCKILPRSIQTAVGSTQ